MFKATQAPKETVVVAKEEEVVPAEAFTQPLAPLTEEPSADVQFADETVADQPGAVQQTALEYEVGLVNDFYKGFTVSDEAHKAEGEEKFVEVFIVHDSTPDHLYEATGIKSTLRNGEASESNVKRVGQHLYISGTATEVVDALQLLRQ
jgi:hypothetical protein